MLVPAAKVEKVASRDLSRPVLCALHLRISEDRKIAHLEATDSYKAVRVPVEIEDQDEAGLVSVDAIAAARRVKGPAAQIVLCNGDLGVPLAGQRFTRPEGEFPNLPQLWPEPAALSSFEIGLNAKFLYELAQGLGSDTVRIRFHASPDGSLSPLRPMFVRPISVSRASRLLPSAAVVRNFPMDSISGLPLDQSRLIGFSESRVLDKRTFPLYSMSFNSPSFETGAYPTSSP